MTEKKCINCEIIKDISEFYKHKRMSDGYLNKCKCCQKKSSAESKKRNPEKYKAHARKYASKDDVKKRMKERRMSANGIEMAKIAQEAYRKKYPKKARAHNLFSKAVMNGQIIRENKCSICSSMLKIEAHHDDYNKPFDVRWLCELCHKDWHIKNKPIY